MESAAATLVAMKIAAVEDHLQVKTVQYEKMSSELNESRTKNEDLSKQIRKKGGSELPAAGTTGYEENRGAASQNGGI